MTFPVPTPIYRFLHVDSLETCLRRGGLCAPNHTPNDVLNERMKTLVERILGGFPQGVSRPVKRQRQWYY